MEKVILLLQGGAALGAYQYGAFRAVADYLTRSHGKLAMIAGASIGGINGALIARHGDDLGTACQALDQLWRQEFAHASWPFSPLPIHGALNGILTGMLLGHPRLFQPTLAQPADLSALSPFFAPYRSGPMLETLERMIGNYRQADGPRLLVRAVETHPPRPVLFDSSREPITPTMLVASASIPLAFPFHQIGDKTYWDGEFWPHSLADTLRDTVDLHDGDSYHVISIELYRPEAGLEELRRASGRVRVTRIFRPLTPNDWLFRPVFDWAPERIDALIAQGEHDAQRALAAQAVA